MPDPSSPSSRTAGRLTGSLFLAAFVLYGVGSSLAPEALGSTLVLANSAAVVVIGLLCARALRPVAPTTARVYLVARLLESVLLAVGLWFVASGRSDDDIVYATAMVVLGVGSLPFCRALAGRWVPPWFALWGGIGYVLMATGALLGLALPDVGVYLSVPGGLFEITLGVFLLVRGFPSADAVSARRERVRPAGAEVA